jgi:hypothetical protein
MKVRFALLLTMALLAMPTHSQAQEMTGQLWDIQTMKVSPHHMDEFMATAGKVAEAAKISELGSEWAWHMWTRNFEVAIASPIQNMAHFDDPEAWMREFAGTPGESMVNEAMNTIMTKISIVPASREVWEQVPEWSYAPANPSFETPAAAERHDFWIKAGMQEAFDGVAKDIIAFFADMGGQFPVNGYRVHFGDVGRVSFIVFVDDLGNLYGENSLENAVAAMGKTAEWEAIMTRMRDCVTESDKSQMTYLPEISYTGAEM